MNNSLLYLEDDAALALITTRALEKKGFAVHHAESIEGFTKLLGTTDFTHVLLDLKIGNQTSFQLIQEIKAFRDVPIVILTGYGTIRTAVQAMKLGAVNFLSKPCGVDEIIAAFNEFDASIDLEKNADVIEKPSLKALEWENIQKALDDNQGNISAAARQLKMHRRTLQRKLEKRHLE